MCDGTSVTISDSDRQRGLKQVLSQKQIDRAIGDQLRTRHCKRITNQQLIWLIIGMGLFAGKSYRQIFRLGSNSQCTTPSRATLTSARKRLAADLIGQLCRSIVQLLARSTARHPFAFYKGLRLMGVDGTLLDCPDTDSNRKEFGRTSTKFPMVRFPKSVSCRCVNWGHACFGGASSAPIAKANSS